MLVSHFLFVSDLEKKCDVYEVIMNAGDILIVPANWWHYVENLDLSLTVNTWIPLAAHDAYARLEECFVRTQIEKITETDDYDDVDALRKYIFNPNEVRTATLIENFNRKHTNSCNFFALSQAPMTDVNLLNLFKPLADIILETEKTLSQCEDSKAKLILEEHSDMFRRMAPISWNRFQEIIARNSQRFDRSLQDTNNAHYQDIENVINALCHPKTVRSACDLYLQQIRDCNNQD